MFKKALKNLYGKNKSTLPSFTLNEMLVVLVLSAILAGMAISVTGYVRKQMAVLEKGIKDKTRLNLLKQALWVDFNRFNRIYHLTNENTLWFANETDSISYVFLEQSVVREKDTFTLPTYQKVLYFRGNVVSQGKIDALRINSDKKQYFELYLFAAQAPSAYHYID